MNLPKTFQLFFITSITITFLLSNCTPKNAETEITPESIVTPTQITTPAPTPTALVVPGYQPLTPKNIQNIELIAEMGTGNSYDAALSPDGKSIAALTKYKLIVYDRNTFKEKYSVPVSIPSNSVIIYSPDGKQIVFSNTKIITFLDADDGSYLHSFTLCMSYKDIEEIIFIPENDRLLVIGLNYQDSLFGVFSYLLFDLDGHKLFDREFSHRSANDLFRFINKQRTALMIYQNSGEAVFPMEIYIIDNETGNVLAAAYKEKTNNGSIEETIIGSKEFLPSQNEIKSWAKENEIIPTEKQLPDCSVIPKVSSSKISVLARDDKTALLKIKADSNMNIDNTNIRIEELDLLTCKLIRHIDFPSVLTSGIFSPDDKYFVEDNEFSTYVWDLSNSSIWLEFPGKFSTYSTQNYGFNSDGSKLLIGPDVYDTDSSISFDAEKNTITVFDMQNGNMINKIGLTDSLLSNIWSTFSPDFMVFNYLNSIEIWNIVTPELIADIPNGAHLLDQTRNGIWILSLDESSVCTTKMFDLISGELIKEFSQIYHCDAVEFQLLENASILEINYHDNIGRYGSLIIDTDNGIILSKETFENSTGNGFSGTELSQWLFSKSDYKQKSIYKEIDPFIVDSSIEHEYWVDPKWHSFWDIETSGYLGFLRTEFPVTDIIISPNHYFLAAIGSDGIIRIFGVKDE